MLTVAPPHFIFVQEKSRRAAPVLVARAGRVLRGQVHEEPAVVLPRRCQHHRRGCCAVQGPHLPVVVAAVRLAVQLRRHQFFPCRWYPRVLLELLSRRARPRRGSALAMPAPFKPDVLVYCVNVGAAWLQPARSTACARSVPVRVPVQLPMLAHIHLQRAFPNTLSRAHDTTRCTERRPACRDQWCKVGPHNSFCVAC
jgi:hypothetical protein